MTDSPNFIDSGSPPGDYRTRGQGQKAGIYISLPSKYGLLVLYLLDFLLQRL